MIEFYINDRGMIEIYIKYKKACKDNFCNLRYFEISLFFNYIYPQSGAPEVGGRGEIAMSFEIAFAEHCN